MLKKYWMPDLTKLFKSIYLQKFCYAGYETFYLKITCLIFLANKYDGNKAKSIFVVFS